MNLECSSRGDKRFSAFYAVIMVDGVQRSIEEHYQLSKRSGDFIPVTWKDMKGKKPTHFVVNQKEYDVKYLSMWYSLLWVKYFVKNPELIEYIQKFETFSDKFSKPGMNNQAEVIAMIKENGLKYMLDECKPLVKLMS